MKNLILKNDYNGVFNYVMNLKKFDINDSKKLNGKGIYFLFNDDVITYIGISQDIYNRIFCSQASHIDNKIFNKYAFINLDLDNRDLEFYEYFLISLFMPYDNHKHRGFSNYEFLNNDYKIKKEKFDEFKKIELRKFAIQMAKNYFK